ncbi:symmetrical bis(5'-nucleosyl)-tetraphosphatase [Nitratifractor sp.]
MIWGIGDIQGCYDPFMRLLENIGFDPARDELWLVGDLVNRGKKSREVLEWVYEHRRSVRVVLGNHDIALLAVWWGLKKSNPTLDPILEDPRAEEWMEWLRSRPFVHLDAKLGWVMAHAGIPPEFGLGTALHYNRILQRRLQSEGAAEWLAKMMKGSEDHFDPLGNDLQHERYMLAGFIRMRYCRLEDCRLDFKQKGTPTPELRQKGLVPWFECPGRKRLEEKILFGHWSTLGYFENDEVCCLDSGCLWQKEMTAKRLDGEGGEVVRMACPEGIKPR